jgi:AhpD family alkylhydroperoxidase
MTRQEERAQRAQQSPIVGGLPDVPGIGAAMRLTPNLGLHLRGLADELLVNDFPGATISRGEREMLATAVSAGNDCFFCMDSHAAHAAAVLEHDGRDVPFAQLDSLELGGSEGFDSKMAALLHISRTVRRNALQLTASDVEAAIRSGASDGDVQLAVLIAAGFSMYNRMVDGLRARTAPSTEAYRPRASEIAARGYSAPPGAIVPPASTAPTAPTAPTALTEPAGATKG